MKAKILVVVVVEVVDVISGLLMSCLGRRTTIYYNKSQRKAFHLLFIHSPVYSRTGRTLVVWEVIRGPGNGHRGAEL
jgi:hypothetical protein